VAIGPAFIALPKLVAFAGALVASALLLLIVARTDLGRAIRAVAKEKQGAKLMGIDVDHVYAMSFGIGLACLGAAACFLLPAYYVNPQVGGGFVLVAFTIVVLGGMGSFAGALLGGPADRRGRVAVRAVPGRVAGADRHLRDLHRGAAVPASGAVRGARMKRDLLASPPSPAARCSPPWSLVLDSGVWLTFVMMALYAALLAQAWNMLGGYGGQFSFGHALFFGTGAYTQAIAQLSGGLNAWLALALAVAPPAAVAVPWWAR
jgi:branched-subunit amino acid ABC-type transport system permease component